MSAVNPYQPPTAHVQDAEDDGAAVQPIRLWSSRGRIGRLRFLAYGVGAYLVLAVACGVAVGLGTLVSPVLTGLLIFAALVPYAVFCVLVGIQRSHDMGWSGWTMLLMFVPLVGLIWVFNGGTPGRNDYGAPPPPNTWGVRLLALILPVIMVIGILAAIALPAYQDYVKRAQAKQVH